MNCAKVSSLFSKNEVTPPKRPKFGLRVPSLFDGISTGMVVLKMLGISVEKYYASEVDKDAINVSRLNHGSMMEHKGGIEMINTEKLCALGPTDLLLGGSPCADPSLVKPNI
jgi:site-specific DNA-cytosine methylase